MPQPNKAGVTEAIESELSEWWAAWTRLHDGLWIRSGVGGYLDRIGYLLDTPRPCTVRPHLPSAGLPALVCSDFVYRILLRNAAPNWKIRGSRRAMIEILRAYLWANPIIEQAWINGAWVWVVGESYVGEAPQTIVGGVFDANVWLCNCLTTPDEPQKQIVVDDGLVRRLAPFHVSLSPFFYDEYRHIQPLANDVCPQFGLGDGTWDPGELTYVEQGEYVRLAALGSASGGAQYTSCWIESGLGYDGPGTIHDQEWFVDWVVMLAEESRDRVTVTGEIRARTPPGDWTEWAPCEIDDPPPRNGADLYTYYQIRLTITADATVPIEDFALIYICLKWLTTDQAAYLRPE